MNYETKKADVYQLEIDGRSNDKQLEMEMANIFYMAFELWKDKQAAYGNKAVGGLGEPGIFVRVWDKVMRLYTLIWLNGKNNIADENIEDTWLDLLNYAAMAIVIRNGRWPK